MRKPMGKLGEGVNQCWVALATLVPRSFLRMGIVRGAFARADVSVVPYPRSLTNREPTTRRMEESGVRLSTLCSLREEEKKKKEGRGGAGRGRGTG